MKYTNPKEHKKCSYLSIFINNKTVFNVDVLWFIWTFGIDWSDKWWGSRINAMSVISAGSHTGTRTSVFPLYRRIPPSKVSSLLPDYMKKMANRVPSGTNRRRPPFLYTSPKNLPLVVKGGSQDPVLSGTFLNRGCPVLRCPSLRISPRCKVPVFFRYHGRLCRGCYRNLCRKQY